MPFGILRLFRAFVTVVLLIVGQPVAGRAAEPWDRPVRIDIVRILVILEEPGDIIDRVPPGIVRIEAQPLRQVAPEIHLHRIVAR